MIKDKVIVITGAGGVLCGKFAVELSGNGNKIALLDINEQMAQANADVISAQGGIAKAYKTNVLDKASITATREQILKDFGKCDVLINGAGGNNPRATADKEYYEAGDEKVSDVKTFFNLDQSGIEFVFNLNFMGTLLPTQVFACDMIGRDGVVLNISSMNAFRPLTKIPAYSGAKSAVSNLTQWLSVYFAKAGIRVNAIAPGFFVTNQNKALLFSADGKPTARTGKILNATPMGRFGQEIELMGAVEFLLDNAKSSFITGVVLPIDGGFSAYSGV